MKRIISPTLLAAAVFAAIISIPFIIDNENEKGYQDNMYECPCEAEDLVVDRIFHVNSKSGDTTVTTIIDVDKCIKLWK